MTHALHQIASSVKANYPSLGRLTEFGSSITFRSVRVQPGRTGPTSFYCNRLSPRFMWPHPTPNGSPPSTGLGICERVAEFTDRGCKTKRCDCIHCSPRGKMKNKFCASRGAAAQRVRGAVSCCRACLMAPGEINEGIPTGRALA